MEFLQNWLAKLYKTFIASGYYKMMLEGFGNTILITVGALAIGVAIGVLIAMVKYLAEDNAAFRPFAKLCDIYVTAIRGIPVVVLLLMTFLIIFASSDNGVLVAVITFGIKEHRDCLSWVDYMVKRWPDRKIILTGISMGAATVVMAAGEPLPENVIGVLADCGYTSPKEIICEVIRQMKLPPKLSYPFVKLGAKIFGKFDLEEITPVEYKTYTIEYM